MVHPPFCSCALWCSCGINRIARPGDPRRGGVNPTPKVMMGDWGVWAQLDTLNHMSSKRTAGIGQLRAQRRGLRLGICARSFWGHGVRIFYGVRGVHAPPARVGPQHGGLAILRLVEGVGHPHERLARKRSRRWSPSIAPRALWGVMRAKCYIWSRNGVGSCDQCCASCDPCWRATLAVFAGDRATLAPTPRQDPEGPKPELPERGDHFQRDGAGPPADFALVSCGHVPSVRANAHRASADRRPHSRCR